MNRFWVNDETRYVRATVGEAVTLPGWREVTGAEFDAFRAETRVGRLGPWARDLRGGKAK